MFGLDELDDGLGGLDPCGLHEVRPESHRDWGATLTFALALAIRRMRSDADRTAPLLWCATQASMREVGMPYAPGLLALGLSPDRLLMVETRRQDDI
ncbi:MAG TPA: hypothetical protein PK264_15830, partial [Hyphomicrobiaceae bacterium]|nr:hypothetical protein [Hyphomicrobiaceae bacterium]